MLHTVAGHIPCAEIDFQQGLMEEEAFSMQC